MATLHTIKAYLYGSTFTENPNDFIARVSSERSLSIRDICESAATRGGADIPAATMEHAVNLWFKEMGYQLCDGFSINTGWFMASTHIKGVFNSPSETFHPDKHTLLFEFQQGAQLRRELEQVTVEIMGVADTLLVILQVTDVKTGSVNDLLTPSHNLKIAGNKLKIAGDNAANGVWFINQDTQARTRVDVSDITVNNPKELIIMTPALAAGPYKLEITTQYGVNILLKSPRTTVFDKILTVQ